MQLDYEVDKKGIGKRLQNERLRLGLTQDKLSELIGCTAKYLSKVENGSSVPSLPFILKFSEVTEGDLNYLLRGICWRSDGHQEFMVRESSPIYDPSFTKLSKKGRRLREEIMKSIDKILEENSI